MSTKEAFDVFLRFLAILVSWPVMILFVVILVRKQLPEIVANLSKRVTKAPGGWEFAALQERVEALHTKVEGIKVAFEKSAALTPHLQDQLQSTLEGFQAYLGKLGYEDRSEGVTVLIDPALKDNAHYTNGRIVVGEPLAGDPSVVMREYAHHALTRELPYDGFTEEEKALESGLADYFACSFADDPLMGKGIIHLYRSYPGYETKTAVRDLSQVLKFTKGDAFDFRVLGEQWGSAFWELRRQLGREAADKILFDAWESLNPGGVDVGTRENYFNRLIAVTSPEQAKTIRSVFERRGLKAK
jgi:hypothetical protein